jgi:rhamnose utilization protein RhaD (predicted bifunctional aldolase and dehydrogenase)/NAD(P)-dependent dehydrogenase (short-subunit alcohol dehydrogenase family)
MKDAYRDDEARAFVRRHPDLPEALALRIYTARLIGSETTLVLDGGGNTSVKLRLPNVLGDEQEALFIKGSGANLATIGAEGFTGVDLAYFRRFRELEALSEEEMEDQLLAHRLRADAPAPSVETLLHAFLPHRYIDHTHADAVLVLTNRSDGEECVAEALGSRVAVLPYEMPGLSLAQQVATCYEANPALEAIVSLNHGIFTFGEEARISYARMIDYVSRAESYIEARGGIRVGSASPRSAAPDIGSESAARVAQALRGACCHEDGASRRRRFVAELRTAPEWVEFSRSPQAREMCRSGVLTPDHAIRTKNRMLLLEEVPRSDEDLTRRVREAVDAYCQEYHCYFDEQMRARRVERRMLDPYPRVALLGGVGIAGLGSTPHEARVAADIAEHTLRAKRAALALGAYEPIGDGHVFDMEYWSLQQRKLDSSPPPLLQGQVAFVTGAGGAIGAGIADRLLAAGAVVAISDVDEQRLEKAHAVLARSHPPDRILGLACDVTKLGSIEAAYTEVSCRVGGIDLLVPNAGVAHVATLEALEPERFERVLGVNLMGTFNTIKAVIPIFRRQASGGNIVLISSKNVPDPGAAFGAYSASKAGAHQIAKIAALELAELGVRVNMVNPDAVFGDDEISSGLWDLIGPDRMRSRGLDPAGLREHYRQRNLLKASVLPEHVGNAVVFFASEQTPTTGASFPVDGGVPSAFPR